MKNKSLWVIALMFVVAFLYLGFWCAPLLQYEESLHLFLYDSDFICSWFDTPGGVLALAGEFLSQFYYEPILGALILSSLLAYIAWAGAKLYFRGNIWGCVVPLCVLFCIADNECPAGFIVGLSLVMLMAQIERKWPLNGYTAPAMVVVTFLIAPFFGSLLSLLFVSSKLFVSPRASYRHAAYVALAWVAVVAVAYFWLYPSTLLSNMMWAGSADNFGGMYQLLSAFLILSPAIRLLMRREYPLWINLVAVALGGALVFFTANFDSTARSLTEMDREVRAENWDKVIEIAATQEQLSRQHTFYVALALNQTHRMGDSLFCYPQLWGSDVLYDNFNYDQMTLFRLSEMYLAIGHTNFAYRMSMENVVLNASRPSARMLRMMALCAMINGDKEVAYKYLNTLSKTLYYKRWADMQLRGENAEGIRFRQNKLPKDNLALGDGHNSYLYFKTAHLANPDNVEVLDYLIADVLLKGRLDIFVGYLPAIERLYPTLPEIYQQAVAVYWAKTGEEELFNRYIKSQKVIDTYKAFTEVLGNTSLTMVQRDAMFEKFKNTYFYYFVKSGNEKPKSNINTGSIDGMR